MEKTFVRNGKKYQLVGECNHCGECCSRGTMLYSLDERTGELRFVGVSEDNKPCRMLQCDGTCKLLMRGVMPEVCKMFPSFPEEIENLPNCGLKWKFIGDTDEMDTRVFLKNYKANYMRVKIETTIGVLINFGITGEIKTAYEYKKAGNKLFKYLVNPELYINEDSTATIIAEGLSGELLNQFLEEKKYSNADVLELGFMYSTKEDNEYIIWFDKCLQKDFHIRLTSNLVNSLVNDRVIYLSKERFYAKEA